MSTCVSCGTVNREGSQFCDQCGALLKTTAPFGPRNGGESAGAPQMVTPIPAYVPPSGSPSVSPSVSDAYDTGPETGTPGAHVTSLGGLVPSDPAPPMAPETMVAVANADTEQKEETAKNVHAKLIIERGSAVGTEFSLSTNEAYIGRWDADNGIFPDVDLDAHDPEAKVSRRHARITFKDGTYSVEDLGSTNGTFINRGRRLLPGNPNILKDGDEIIVGKTFLRFHVVK
ncbi:MAG TPA: FHA domain-containing protein [Pyrinomonadaceae bacterium]|jgi:hypothetical protein|nr:FHA domain-containing protein [Pyrinomonadaceae bacterium]